MKALVLRDPVDGGVFNRATYGTDDERRVWLERQREGWWYNAPHYCPNGLEIAEE